jgi:hypothetical protein
MQRSDLHVVGGYYNPNRYKTPPRLLRQWVADSLDSGVTLYLVELAIGDQPFEFSKDETSFQHVNLIQIRGHAGHRVWQQHPLYDVGFSRVPDAAKVLCWQDTDLKHLNPDWAMDVLHCSQSHRIGQTWTHAIDLDPNGNIAKNDWGNEVDRSFCAAWLAGEVDLKAGPYAPSAARALLPTDKQRDWRSHTGFSWFIRKTTLQGLGRLMPWQIAGSADYHMAHGFAGNLRQMAEDGLNDKNSPYTRGYYDKLIEFAELCEEHVRQDLGCVSGTITHGWHGSKLLRFYGGREDILRESGFDPDKDVAYDVHGLPFLRRDNRLLRDGLRRYDSRRNADCIRIDTK